MRILLLFLALSACPLSLLTETPAEIVSFTGSIQPCMLHEGCATFEWETRGAGRISLASGAVDEQGVFRPGGWHSETDLPPAGASGFRIKIGNYAAQLCIEAALSEPVCAVCDPFDAQSCPQ
jgi:hypothetical protein